MLPSGFQAITATDAAAEQTEQVREGLGFLRTALLVFAFVALFVGAFVIFNTFNIVVTQRTRELGLLRALGASRGQVFRSVVIESLVIGLLGSAVGLAAGIGLAVLLKQGLEAIGLELPPTPLAIRPTTIIAAFVVGTVVTVVASVFPARRASRVSPIEALREGTVAPTASLRRRSIVGGVRHGARCGGDRRGTVRRRPAARGDRRPGRDVHLHRRRGPVPVRGEAARDRDRGSRAESSG